MVQCACPAVVTISLTAYLIIQHVAIVQKAQRQMQTMVAVIVTPDIMEQVLHIK